MQPNRPFDALPWALAHALAVTLASMAIKVLSDTVPIPEQVFARSLIGLVVVAIVMRRHIGPLFGPGWPLLLLRAVAGFVGTMCTFYAFSRLPLMIAMILTLLTPVFTLAIGAAVLRERMTAPKVGFAMLALASVGVTVYPPDGLPAVPADRIAYGLAVSVGLLGSLASAVAFVAMRAALRTSSVQAVVLWFMACSTGLALLTGGSTFVAPSYGDALLLVALALAGLLSDVFKTRAHKHAFAGIVSVLSLASVAFAAVLGWLVFGEAVGTLQLYGITGLMVSIALLTAPDRGIRRA